MPATGPDVDLAGEVFAAQERLETAQIALHARAHEGVQRGGGGALVFAVFAHDLVRQRHEQIGRGRADQLADAPLVLRIGVSVQEAHGHRFDAQRREGRDQLAHLILVERRQHRALGVDALGDFEGQLARNQRLRPVKEQVERLDPVAASDRIDVAKAARRDQGGAGALTFQHGVDRDRRSVQHLGKRRYAAVGDRQARGHAACGVGRHRRRLRRDDAPVDAADEVGKGPADIDADDVHEPLRIEPARICRCRAPSPPAPG